MHCPFKQFNYKAAKAEIQVTKKPFSLSRAVLFTVGITLTIPKGPTLQTHVGLQYLRVLNSVRETSEQKYAEPHVFQVCELTIVDHVVFRAPGPNRKTLGQPPNSLQTLHQLKHLHIAPKVSLLLWFTWSTMPLQSRCLENTLL